MSVRYLSNVRHVPIYSSQAGKVNGHAMKFNLPGLQSIEPSFANLIVAGGEVAYGVVHEVSKRSLRAVLGSESDLYTMVEREVRLASGQIVIAHTLLGVDHGEEATPSQRYLDIMIQGARENHLPQTYIHSLEQRQGAYIPVLSELVGCAIYLMVIVSTWADA